MKNGSFVKLTEIGAMSVCLAAPVKAQEHVHGEGRLYIVQDNHSWNIHLGLPAADGLGFEHAPRTDEEKSAIRALFSKFFYLVKVVKPCWLCAVEDMDAAIPEQNDDYEHQHNHNDLESSYQLSCQSEVGGMEVKLFEWLPSLDHVELKGVIADGQGASTLSAATSAIS